VQGASDATACDGRGTRGLPNHRRASKRGSDWSKRGEKTKLRGSSGLLSKDWQICYSVGESLHGGEWVGSW